MKRGDFFFHKITCLCERGCGTKLTDETRTTHVCPLIKITCPAASFGCTEQPTRKDYDEHITLCEFELLRRSFEPLLATHKRSMLELRNLEIETKRITNEVDQHQRDQLQLTQGFKTMEKILIRSNRKLKQSIQKLQSTTHKQRDLFDIPFNAERTRFSCIVGTGSNISIYTDGVFVESVKILKHGTIKSLVAISTSQIIIIPHNQRYVISWDPKTRDKVDHYKLTEQGVQFHSYSFLCSRLAVCTTNHIDVFNLTDVKTVTTYSQKNMTAVLVLQNGNLMIGTKEGMVHIYDGERKKFQFKDKSSINSMCQLENGQVVIGTDVCMSIWSTKGKRLHLISVQEPIDYVFAHSYSIITASNDGAMRTWSNGGVEKGVIPGRVFSGKIVHVNMDIAILCGDRCYICDVIEEKLVSMFKLQEPATDLICVML